MRNEDVKVGDHVVLERLETQGVLTVVGREERNVSTDPLKEHFHSTLWRLEGEKCILVIQADRFRKVERGEGTGLRAGIL